MLAKVVLSTINVSFDMMQNQPIPKLSVSDTLYIDNCGYTIKHL